MATGSTFAHTPFVVVDLETTGGSAMFDRVLEVAALRVEDGVVRQRIECLVDPGIPIPPIVTRITGINTALVRGRPAFETLLPDLSRLFEGAVVVAHNASFDCNFLSQAFLRAGLAWEGQRLCTLRLARRLIPGLHSYKLDSLCAFLGSSFVQRHRAGPDAEATLSLLGHLLEAAVGRGIESVASLLRIQHQPLSHGRRKGRVDEALVASLPTGPGVYLLKDHRGQVVYVGKSVNIRSRVRTHLRPSGTAHSPAQPRLRRRLPLIADVEAIETGSELEALLLESKLVKRYLPLANSLLRDYHDYPFIKVDLRDPYPRLEATRERPSDGVTYFGPFRRAGMVSSAVLFLNEELGLRQCGGVLKAGQQPCALLEMKKCLGPCVNAVAPADYRAAVDQAVGVLCGQDSGLLERATIKRDALAEQMRFEQAAELRDRIRDVEQVVAVQQRLRGFAERNVVLVAGDKQPDRARLMMVRAGRLVEQVSLPVRATPSHLRHLLRRVYVPDPSPQVSRDELDDLLILDAWLKRHKAEVQEVSVSAIDPPAAAPALGLALRQLAGSTGESGDQLKRSMPSDATAAGRSPLATQPARAAAVAGASKMPVL